MISSARTSIDSGIMNVRSLLLGSLDPRADQPEQHTSDNNGQREADQAKSQSLQVIHGTAPFPERLANRVT